MLRMSFILCPSSFINLMLVLLHPSTCSFFFHADRTPLEFPTESFWILGNPRLPMVSLYSLGQYINVLWLLLRTSFPPLCSAPHQRWLLMLTLRNELWSLKTPCVFYCLFHWPWSSFRGKCLTLGLDHLLHGPLEAGTWSQWEHREVFGEEKSLHAPR